MANSKTITIITILILLLGVILFFSTRPEVESFYILNTEGRCNQEIGYKIGDVQGNYNVCTPCFHVSYDFKSCALKCGFDIDYGDWIFIYQGSVGSYTEPPACGGCLDDCYTWAELNGGTTTTTLASCFDSDGNNKYEYGYVLRNGVYYYDSCDGTYSVNEYTCTGTLLSKTTFNCQQLGSSYRCLTGTCGIPGGATTTQPWQTTTTYYGQTTTTTYPWQATTTYLGQTTTTSSTVPTTTLPGEDGSCIPYIQELKNGSCAFSMTFWLILAAVAAILIFKRK